MRQPIRIKDTDRLVLCVRRRGDPNINLLRHGFRWEPVDGAFVQFYFVNPYAREWETLVVLDTLSEAKKLAKNLPPEYEATGVKPLDWVVTFN